MQLILIAGGSGAGKTALSDGLCAVFGPENCSVLHMDDYYFPPAQMYEQLCGRENWDAPGAVNWRRFTKDIRKLLHGSSVLPPHNSMLFGPEGLHLLQTGSPIEPKDLLIVEGMYALYRRSLNLLSRNRLFLLSSDGHRLNRRRRHHVTPSYFDSVHRPMYTGCVLPTMSAATIVVDVDALSETEVLREALARIRLR
jgi:uridine kinase